MQHFPYTQAQPVTLAPNLEAKVYGLFAVSMALTGVGVYIGAQFSEVLLSSGIHVVFLIAQLGIIFTSRLWMNQTPLNYLLFSLFPVLSGVTITPYILYVLAGYANGGSILLHASSATAFMAAAAAVFARTTSWNLSVLGRTLFMALLGLIFLAVLQIFVPALRTTQTEMLISGAGIVIFALFTAYDLQRIQALGRSGASPFMLALSLYLDIFNLFLYTLRFMLILSGERR